MKMQEQLALVEEQKKSRAQSHDVKLLPIQKKVNKDRKTQGSLAVKGNG